MENQYKEWLKQASYDLATAKAMLEARRNIYVVFMCHLGIEKALKGLYQKETRKIPPKTHSLAYFVNTLKLEPDVPISECLAELQATNIVTRYPEDIDRAKKAYGKKKAAEILKRSQKVPRWIKKLAK